MKALLTWSMLLLATPVGWAQIPTPFETLVECDLPAGKFSIFRSDAVERYLFNQRREVHGEMELRTVNRHEQFGSSIGFEARSSDPPRYVEFQLTQCGRAAEAPICGAAGVWENRQIVGPAYVGGSYAFSEAVPFSLQITAARQLTIRYGENTAALDLPFDIIELRVKCVGASGRISFDLVSQPLS